MAGASRRGCGEDGIYFDHRADCRDSAHHKTCSGRWRGVVSLGFDADRKRIRRKVSDLTRTEVKNRLKAVHSELDAGVRSAAGYMVEKAVADWLDEGLPGRGPLRRSRWTETGWRPATGARGRRSRGRLLPVTSWLTPFGDGGAGGVPQGAGVVPVAVQFEHGVHDVLDAAALVDDAAEVA
jgi:hypothetical protein